MKYNIKEYIIDDTFRMTLSFNNIYIYNYGKIVDISDTLVSIINKENEIKIYGSSLVIKKLDKREMIITGKFLKVEL